MLYWRAPNTEAGENTAYNNVRVGRPQHRELEHQFQQAMQVGGAPTQRNWNTNFYRQSEVGERQK